MGYQHKRIHHPAKVYVLCDTQIDGFWSLIKKRGIGSLQLGRIAVSQTYLDEYSYRQKRRDQGNLIFKSVLGEVSKRAV